VGAGQEEQTLRNLVQSLQLTSRIKFLGRLQGQNLVECLAEHEFILIPSRWNEPFGIVALEGMACGCLPIAADGGGLPSAVGKAGIIFKKENEGSLYEAMKTAIDNAELVQEKRKNMEDHLANFTGSGVAKKYLSIFEHILSD
jgi:glycosyltransferase involved in cell wall biosynthesis